MIVIGAVILQDSMDLLEVAPGACSEIYDTSSHDGNEIVSIKVEDVPDMQEEEDPLLITFPVVKDEHEVSHISVTTSYILRFSYYLLSPPSVCHIKLFYSDERILRTLLQKPRWFMLLV
jgi:hypothetical protein